MNHSRVWWRTILIPGCLIALPLMLVVACRHSSPGHVVTDAQLNVQRVKEFETTFPGGFHWISYYTGLYGHPAWNSEVGLFGRYVLTMQATIDLNTVRSRVVGFGNPSFVLVEVREVEVLPDGRLAIHRGTAKQFGLDDWARLLASKGDLKSIGLQPIADQPVLRFDRALTNR